VYGYHLVDFQNRLPVALMMMRGRILLANLILAPLMSACSADLVVPQPPLPTVDACFVTPEKSVAVTLERAEEFSQRQVGLMGRQALKPSTGMLFVYQEPQRADHGFWMYRTLIHLDIAYLDANGVIGSIRNMAPCSSDIAGNCPAYPAGFEFTQAVEMNRGFFSEHHITTGDQLLVGEHACQEG
jgi:uncharacterized membrane protein (UPF0127 family)